MPTLISHPAVALGLFPWFRNALRSRAVLLAGVVLTVLPDSDVIGLRLGVPYLHMFGHRGLSHSIFFAAVLSGVLAWFLSKSGAVKTPQVWIFLFLCAVSHGVLDALTSGGEGVAFFAPFYNDRYFFPAHPIRVSPLSLKLFFQERGLVVLKSEFQWVWLPAFFIFFAGTIFRKIFSDRGSV